MAWGAIGTVLPVTFNADVLGFGGRVDGAIMTWKGKRWQISDIVDARHCTGTLLDYAGGEADEDGDGTDDWGNATNEWTHPAWSDVYGYPRTGAFLNGRLWAGGTTQDPSLICGSKVSSYFSWDTGTAEDSDAIVETIEAGVPGTLRHLISGTYLVILSDSGIWYVPGTDSSAPTPSNMAFSQISATGAGLARPWLFDNAVMFLDYAGRTVNQAAYLLAQNAMNVSPVSLLGEHLIKTPVSATSIEPSATRPEKLAILCNSDGTLATLLAIQDQEIICWMPWETSSGSFLDVAGVGEYLFAVTERGDGIYHLEIFVEDAAPLDCAYHATSEAKTREFAGFDHLAGQTVRVVTRGHDLGDYAVAADGSITLDDTLPEVYEIEAGYFYEQLIRTLPLAMDMSDGPGRTAMKRLRSVTATVNDAGEFIIGGRAVLPTFQGDDYDDPPVTTTGLVEKRLAGISRDGAVDITTTKAVKFELLAITREVWVQGVGQ